MRLALGALFLIVASSTAARADSAADAAAAAKQAEALATSGRYPEAAAKYRAAYALDPRPDYLCNVGVVYQRAKQLPRAQIYLGECLSRGTALDASFIALVRKALVSVEDKLRAGQFAPIDVVVSPLGASLSFTTFDNDERFIGSRVVWLPFGTHEVTAAAEGYEPATKSIEVTGQGQQQLRVELIKVAVVAAPVAGPTTREVRNREKDGDRFVAIISTTVTVAFGLGTLATWLKARNVMESAESTSITRDEYDDIVSRGHKWQYLSWGLGAATGVVAVTAGYFWYKAATLPSTRLEVMPTEGGANVSLSGSF